MNSRISGLVVEYIVAIDVTRVRFPADAQVQLARLVREVTESAGGRVCDHCVTTGTLWEGGRGTGSVHTVGVPGAPACGAALRRVTCCFHTGDTQRYSAAIGVTI